MHETNKLPSQDFELDLELDFRVEISSWILELRFRVGFSSEDFELDFRVRMLSCLFFCFFLRWLLVIQLQLNLRLNQQHSV